MHSASERWCYNRLSLVGHMHTTLLLLWTSNGVMSHGTNSSTFSKFLMNHWDWINLYRVNHWPTPNSLTFGRCDCNFKSWVFKLISRIDILSISYEITLMCMFCSHLNSNEVIATKVCTCHDSCAVGSCANICCNLMASNWKEKKYI